MNANATGTRANVPPGFSVLDRRSFRLILRSDLAEGPGLKDFGRLVKALQGGGQGGRRLGGRGGAVAMPLEENGATAIVLKAFQHGGLLGRLSGRRYLGEKRFLRELGAHIEARRRGVPLPEALGLLIGKGPGPFRHGALITREIAGAEPLDRTLAGALKNGGGQPSARKVLDALGAALARMHRSGVAHGDLNLRNILVRQEGGKPEIFFVDLDRARIEEPLAETLRQANLLRLSRSTDKLLGPGLLRERLRVLRAYHDKSPRWKGEWRRLRPMAERNLRLHRLGWRLFGRGNGAGAPPSRGGERRRFRWKRPRVRDGDDADLRPLFDAVEEAYDFPPPEWETVRSKKYRETLRIPFPGSPGRGVYVKIFRPRYKWEKIPSAAIPCAARREWRALVVLHRLGLPVPRPIAFGLAHTATGANRVILVEELKGARPLKETFRGGAAPGGRRGTLGGAPGDGVLAAEGDAQTLRREVRQAVAEAGRLIEQFHRSGYINPDLHPSNILRRRSPRGAELFLVDHHEARILGELTYPERMRNLGEAVSHLMSDLPPTDLLRLVRAYLASMGLPRPEARRWIREVNRHSVLTRFRYYRHRLKKTFEAGRAFDRQRLEGFSIFLRKPFTASEAIKVNEVSQLGSPDLVRMVKNAQKTRVALVSLEPGATPLFCVKSYRKPGMVETLRLLTPFSPARRAWGAHVGFEVRGFEVPCAVALLERPGEVHLVSRAVEGILQIDRHIIERLHGPDWRQRRTFVRDLAVALRNLHLKGVYHNDLKASNVLVREKGAGHFAMLFLDLDGVSFSPELSRRRRAKNLAQLYASISNLLPPRDGARFLRTYGRRTKEERRQLFEEVREISRGRVFLHPEARAAVRRM